jgi:hypothetical protein
MQTMRFSVSRYREGIRVLAVLGFYLIIFSMDRETTSFSQLFLVGNLIALALYGIPTWLLTVGLDRLFMKLEWKHSLTWSLVLGLPAGFMIVMVLLAINMGRV